MGSVAQDIIGLTTQALVGIGNTPSLVVGAAATGATRTIVGTNVSGKITFTTATSLLSSGVVLTLTLANGFSFPTAATVAFCAGNSAFASLMSNLYISSTTTNTVVLSVTVGLSISTTYIGYYVLSGY